MLCSSLCKSLRIEQRLRQKHFLPQGIQSNSGKKAIIGYSKEHVQHGRENIKYLVHATPTPCAKNFREIISFYYFTWHSSTLHITL